MKKNSPDFVGCIADLRKIRRQCEQGNLNPLLIERLRMLEVTLLSEFYDLQTALAQKKKQPQKTKATQLSAKDAEKNEKLST